MIEKYSVLFRDLINTGKAAENKLHLHETLEWLCRAQDATPDRGGSHSYGLDKGWAVSYPETSGYIIPTFLNWAILSGDQEFRKRALEMADWELSVQLEGGAIPAISSGDPVVFDTGQVLFGWLAAFRDCGDDRYLNAAIRGGDWLLENLDSDHIWRKWGNPGATDPNLYNIRFAWALLDLATETGDSRYRTAVVNYIAWVLNQEEERGWFRYNCLTDNEHPLLHTIAYTAQGLLECGALLGDDRCMQAVARIADEVAAQVSPDGKLAGRFGRGWEGTVSWSCLTGMAQMAIVWQRLDQIDGSSRYRDITRKVLDFVKRTQNLKSGNPGIRGGIKGSHPVNGGYLTYRLPNWAAKFFADALILAEYPGFKQPLY